MQLLFPIHRLRTRLRSTTCPVLLTQPYATQGFAYANPPYDKLNTKHDVGGFSCGSLGLARPYPGTAVQTLRIFIVASACFHLSLGLARPNPGTAVQTLGILIVASAVPGYGCANT